MTAITVEQFLTSPSDPEEYELEPAQVYGPAVATDPLTSIAGSLADLVAMVRTSVEGEAEADRLRELHDDLDAKHAVLHDLVLEIEEIIKPSTSKLANTVREAVGRWRGVEPAPVAEPVEQPTPPVLEQPAKDADVEEWRGYATAVGVSADVSQLNRSQIRTALGIEHTS